VEFQHAGRVEPAQDADRGSIDDAYAGTFGDADRDAG
jgi:hypothetical protein